MCSWTLSSLPVLGCAVLAGKGGVYDGCIDVAGRWMGGRGLDNTPAYLLIVVF